MKILKITLLLNNASDHLTFLTDLPEAYYPFKETGQTFTMNAGYDMGEEYCRKHFPEIPLEIINGRQERAKFQQ